MHPSEVKTDATATCPDCSHKIHLGGQCPAWFSEENAPVCGCHTDWPFVSIVIPMRNEEHYIGRCLDSILGSDYPSGKCEILVVDGASEDWSAEIVAQYQEGDADIRLINNPERIQAAAMNLGIAQAKGGVVMRMDAHAIYPSDYVRNCVTLLLASNADNVGGIQEAVAENRFGEAVAAAMNSKFGAGDSKYRTATEPHWADTVPLGAWRKTTLERVGGFRRDWAGNEDYELNVRLRSAGGRIFLEPTIHYRYFVRRSLRDLIRQYRTHGYYKARTVKEHPDSLRWRQMIPPMLVAALVASPLLLLVDWRLGLFVPTLYVAGISAASILTARRKGWRLLPLLPIIFATMHLFWGLGFWRGITRWGPPMIGPGRIWGALRKRDQRA